MRKRAEEKKRGLTIEKERKWRGREGKKEKGRNVKGVKDTSETGTWDPFY